MEHGRYWVALFNEGGENAGVERELARIDGEFGQASRSKWSDVCGEPRCQNKVYAFEIFADEHVVSPSAT